MRGDAGEAAGFSLRWLLSSLNFRLKDNYNFFIHSTRFIAPIPEFRSPDSAGGNACSRFIYFPILTVSLSVNSSPHLLPDLSATIHPPTSMGRQWICASCRSQTGKAPASREQLCSGLPSPDSSSIYWYLRYLTHVADLLSVPPWKLGIMGYSWRPACEDLPPFMSRGCRIRHF